MELKLVKLSKFYRQFTTILVMRKHTQLISQYMKTFTQNKCQYQQDNKCQHTTTLSLG